MRLVQPAGQEQRPIVGTIQLLDRIADARVVGHVLVATIERGELNATDAVAQLGIGFGVALFLMQKVRPFIGADAVAVKDLACAGDIVALAQELRRGASWR